MAHRAYRDKVGTLMRQNKADHIADMHNNGRVGQHRTQAQAHLGYLQLIKKELKARHVQQGQASVVSAARAIEQGGDDTRCGLESSGSDGSEADAMVACDTSWMRCFGSRKRRLQPGTDGVGSVASCINVIPNSDDLLFAESSHGAGSRATDGAASAGSRAQPFGVVGGSQRLERSLLQTIPPYAAPLLTPASPPVDPSHGRRRPAPRQAAAQELCPSEDDCLPQLSRHPLSFPLSLPGLGLH
ncbi:hypothetical protein DIPPA_16271 [Diplonema papillatum]|nr:hypothetical protein DIPPA_16271 [Diplonema papillatum]